MRFFRFWKREQPVERVILSGDSVRRIRPDGAEESVRWEDLEEVALVTTSDGPWAEDIFWVLTGREGAGGCAVPQGAEGSDGLLEALQKLPGFDNEAVIEAMGSTSEARFVCWRKGG